MLNFHVIKVNGKKTNYAYIRSSCCWMVTYFNKQSGSVECVEEIFPDNSEVEELVKDGVDRFAAMRIVARETATTMAEAALS